MEKHLDDMESLIADAISRLDRRIALLVAKLETDGELIVSDQVNLDRAKLMRSEIIAEFDIYNEASTTVTSQYAVIGPDLKKRFKTAGIDLSFTDVDASIVTDWANDANLSMVSLGQQTAAGVGNIVYSTTVSGGNLDDMLLQISQLLVGGVDKAGRPLVNHAKTIATTKYMEIDAVMTKRKAEEAGIERFRYYGSLISDSRDWCVHHVNKVFTKEEINAWEGKSWSGKAPGDPFVARGGWNCRHNFTPVT